MNNIKEAYMWLNEVQGLGSVGALELIRKIGGIEELWDANINRLKQIGLSEQWARRIINSRNKKKCEKKVNSIISRGIKIISIEDKLYPPVLKQIYDPPLILYAKGNEKILIESRLWIAMVGTRRPSSYGEMMAKRISGDLAKLGVGIISGMAKGIDGICHQTAISNDGITVGVLGNGCEVVYPRCNAKLYDEVVDRGGVLISEFEPNQEPLKHHFPRRNRIISGLSNGVVVVEAGIKSGSLITAKFAIDQGRSVMCVPENVNLPRAQGCLYLLKQGAIPIATAQDICDEFDFQVSFADENYLAEKQIYDTTLERALAMIEPASASQIADKLKVDVSEVLLQLTLLEIKGRIMRKAGGNYILR